MKLKELLEKFCEEHEEYEYISDDGSLTQEDARGIGISVPEENSYMEMLMELTAFLDENRFDDADLELSNPTIQELPGKVVVFFPNVISSVPSYRVIDKTTYYRAGVYRHFTEDCKCSTSMTARIDVTELVEYSRQTKTKFYINFLYLLSKVLNSRDDYKMGYLWESEELICYDRVNPTQYVFHEDTETCTPVYSTYYEDYDRFYRCALADLEEAKKTSDYGLDMEHHPNWFDASYISWLSYDSLNIELPDGYLFFAPIINWGRYREENGKLMMPVSVRLNHAIADGFLVANVFRLLEREMAAFCGKGE